MRKLLIILTLLSISVASALANPHKAKLMAMPPFERACVLIRHFETLNEPRHWPNIGFGHVVVEGEPYVKRQYTVAEANTILKKDLSKLCAFYRSFGPDSLLLACLAYNVGSGRLSKSTLLKKLRTGNRDITRDYTAFCHYNGRRHPGLLRRRYLELELFFSR